MLETLLTDAPTILSTTAARWLTLAGALPEGLLTRTPAPGQWSAVDCLQHLLDTEQFVFPVRLRALLAGQDFAAFDPERKDSAGGGTAMHLAAEFARQRSASLAELAEVTAGDLTRTARHSELGVVTLAELLHEWAAHDLMHTVQAERALMQPFIAGAGPWRHYFQDHDVAVGEGA